MTTKLDAQLDEILLNGGGHTWQKHQFRKLLDTEIAKVRRETFMSANVACSFNSDCKNCHANELTLGYLMGPIKANTESNKEGVEVNE